MAKRSYGAEWANYMRQLGLNIAKTRNAKGMSQEHVAYAADLSRYTYQRIERGTSADGKASNPSAHTLMAIAQVLGVTLDDLLPSDNVPDLRAQ
jgi:transcriptional regulator with XRE-family HTH domain